MVSAWTISGAVVFTGVTAAAGISSGGASVAAAAGISSGGAGVTAAAGISSGRAGVAEAAVMSPGGASIMSSRGDGVAETAVMSTGGAGMAGAVVMSSWGAGLTAAAGMSSCGAGVTIASEMSSGVADEDEVTAVAFPKAVCISGGNNLRPSSFLSRASAKDSSVGFIAFIGLSSSSLWALSGWLSVSIFWLSESLPDCTLLI